MPTEPLKTAKKEVLTRTNKNDLKKIGKNPIFELNANHIKQIKNAISNNSKNRNSN